MASRALLAPLRRAAQAARPAGTRAMSGGSYEQELGARARARVAAPNSGWGCAPRADAPPNARAAEMTKWRSITAVAVPGCLLLSVYFVATGEHHHGEKIVCSRACACARPLCA